MVHPSDGEARQYFDGQHPEKVGEARNVRVVLATDGFNPYGMSTAPYTCCTLMDTEKSKDNPKARVDIATLCDRPNLELRPPEGRKKWRRPKADYVLSIEQRREVRKWMKTLRFPDGYAHNVKRGVNLTTLRVNGMKSHDYHVWIERLLPMVVRGFVPENIWQR
jgi:hypothetical protein